MILFYGTPEKDINLSPGWKSMWTDIQALKFQAFAWHYTLLYVKAELLWYLCYLLSQGICARKGCLYLLWHLCLTGSVFELQNYTLDEDCCENGPMLIQKLGAY